MTQQQIEWMRSDLGDTAVAFDDTELNSNWDRLQLAPDDNTRFEAVKGLCFEQLLNNASKLHDYTAGATAEKLSQVVANLEKRFAYYKPALEAARGQQRQVVKSKLRSIPHQERIEPSDVRAKKTGGEW